MRHVIARSPTLRNSVHPVYPSDVRDRFRFLAENPYP
jgi:hypothetical protein